MDNKIFQIFEQAQVSISSHKTCTKMLSQIAEKSLQDRKTITGCYDKILSCSKKEPCADRVIKFFSSFVALQLSCDLLAYFVRYLLNRSRCLDKGVRFRSCQTISTIFDIIELERPDYELDGILWQDMRSVLLPRLRDKDSTVRTWAVRASRNFQDPSDDSDITISEIMRLMSSDSSKDVRIAACEAVVICPITLGELVGRMRDVKSDVRAAVIRRLGDAIEFTNLSQKQRAAFVKYSLSDRDEKVRADARAVVLQWLAKRDYDVPKMLKLMGLRTHTAEAEILAWAIIEESQKEGASPSLRSLVTDQNIIDWGTHSTFGDVSCHDLLWTLARCSYFRKLLPPSQAYERVEHLLPDTVVLCRLLDQGAVVLTGLSDNTQQLALAEMGLSYLLTLTHFVDSSDVAGNVALITLCKQLLHDVNLSEELVDAVLNACSRAHSFLSTSTERDVIAKMIELAQQLWPSMTESEDGEASSDGDSGKVLPQLRSLQIIEWCVQNQTRAASTARTFTDAVLPLVLEALQQPIEELRLSALRCLGLMGVSSQTHCEKFAGIVVQVANAVREDPIIRCQAVEALADMAMVHSNEFIGEDVLVKALLRVMDISGVPVLQRTAAEAAAKLLFSGRIVRSPVLFAQLVKVFFHPFEETEEDDTKSSNVQSAVKGSAAHLDQILSIFFPAFFGAGGQRGGEIAVQAAAHLISDTCRSVRDEAVESMKIYQMLEHMIGWCQFLPGNSSAEAEESSAKRVEAALKAQICASSLKEMLLLGNSRPSHKFLLKELSKTLAALCPCTTWIINLPMATDVLRACTALRKQIILDKVSSKHVDSFCKSCRDVYRTLPETSPQIDCDAGSTSTSILSLAAGLSDMIDEELCLSEGTEGSDDEDFEEETGGRKGRDGRNTAGEDNCGDDNETTLAALPGRGRIARASKAQASSRISQQLSDENEVNRPKKESAQYSDVADKQTDFVGAL